MREIVLDTETTGLDPKSGHRLVEIGGVELVNRFPTGRTWHHYMNPERDMPDEAFQVHGLSAEFLSDKPLFSELAEDFLTFVDDATLVIHNAPFDMGFLNHELQGLGYSPIPGGQVLDTLAMSRRKLPGAQHSLDALCRRFRVDNSGRTLHGALLDAELLAEVYLELIGANQGALALSAEARTGSLGRDYRAPPRPRELAPRLTADEIAAHEAFVRSFPEPSLWITLGYYSQETNEDSKSEADAA